MDCDRILTPTDGSECASAGVDRALELAVESDATVDVLYVVEQEVGRPGDWDIVVERQETEGENALNAAAESGRKAGVEVTKHLRRGRPHEEILGFASEGECDLIVMGTCGRTGFDRFRHAGSTTERVIRNTTVPVLAVPPEEAT